ncbi:MAG: DegT/DnrJ/EryC1/StrS aminotransferase family protein [Alphaproteobacteria bacterium]|nr:DegT/DnrJ/EryC1/StrS aminotransferase family protein [Alphaproteobacteria bacterium]
MTNAAQKETVDIPNIPFIDLQAQRERIADKVDAAVLNAVHEGKYIMGPQVKELEQQLAEFTGAKHCISCSSGTDSLAMVLMAKGVGPGDAVFVPAFTFVATAEVVAWVGATAYFVDVLEDSFNMDPASLEQAIKDAQEAGENPVGVIPVDLFGQPADYPALCAIAEANNLWVMADSAQSFGGRLGDKNVGQWGLATSTSFFPAKPLGCYGDGGALFTDDDELAELLQSVRVHGKGGYKYDNVRIGMNARLDTVQAAILIEKLKIFPSELDARDAVAARYNEGLKDVVNVPELIEGARSAWAQYTLVLPENVDRDDFAASCKTAGVPTAVYYPIPLSQQTGYKKFPVVSSGTAVSESLAQSVISLPMHPYLEAGTQDYIIETVRKVLEA